MVVKTGTKSSAERAPLRRLSSLEKKGGRRVVKELKGSDAEKAVAPHYQRPTANSSNQARVQFKPLTQSPSHFNKGRRSLGLESPDACKYGRKSSLLGSRTSEKSPVKINRLKPSKSFEKTPVKISSLKPSRAFDKSPGSLKLKTPKSDSCSKVLNVARDTCSSNCKHVVKGGDLTVSPEPRCPYHYCSLNHLDRVEPPSVKQFLASRRRLLRTQKSFKWVGLTPVPKGSGVGANSVDTDIVIESGHGVNIDSVVDTGQGLFFVGCGDNKREEDAAEVSNKSVDDPRPEDCQIVDCDDYDDDELLLESGDSQGDYGISIDEISMAESEIKMEADKLTEFSAGDGEVEIDKQEIDIEAIDHDMTSSSYDYHQVAESLADASDVEVRADESVEVIGEDKDGRDDDCDLDVEALVYLQIVESLVDDIDLKVRAEEFLKQFAEDTDGKVDNHGLHTEPSSNHMASNCHDHGQTEESVHLIQVNAVESEFCSQIESDGLVEVPLSELSSCLEDKVKEEDNCILLSSEIEPVSEACTNDSMEQFVVCEVDSDQSEETELLCYSPLNHGTECGSPTEPDCTPGVSFSLENKYVEAVKEEEYDCKSGSNDDSDRIEDSEPRCFIQANVFGPECNSFIESDGLPDASVSEVNSSLKGEVKEEDECISGISECGSVSDDSDQSEKTELKCYIPVNHGAEYSSPTEPDLTPAVSCSLENQYLADDAEDEYDCSSGRIDGLYVSKVCLNDHVELSDGCKDDHDPIEDSEPHCFVTNVSGHECNSLTEPDGLPDASVSEANSPLKGEVEEECISGSSGSWSVSDDSAQSEKIEVKCYIPVNHGMECSTTESGHTPDVSCCLENKYLEDIVEEEYDCSSGNVDGLFVSEVCLNDHVELSDGCKDDYDPIEDSKPHCFIQVNVSRPECDSLTGSDSLPNAPLSEAKLSPKGEAKEQDEYISGSSDCGFVSDVSAYDLIEQSASCHDMSGQGEDSEEQCFVLINALGTDYRSQRAFDGLPNVPFSEANSYPKDEAKEEHEYFSASAGAEMASNVSAKGLTKQFGGWEDDQSANGRSVNEIAEFVTFNVQCISNAEDDSSQNCSVIESFEGPKQVIKEEHFDITGSISDGFDDDYNLTSLFAECKDDSSRENESNSPMQFNDPTEVICPTDNSPFESSISSKFDEGEDVHTSIGGDDNCSIETNGDDFEEQYLEYRKTANEIHRTSNDFDDDHYIDYELYDEMSEEFCDGNSLMGSVPGYESLKSELKGYKIILDENTNKAYRLKFRQGRVYPLDQNSEAEKVDLRHQMTEERRAAHEWMLDYALRNIVKKLSPFRQRKVKLLVEAFETVTPLSKCETNGLPQATRAFTCSRPIQACN